VSGPPRITYVGHATVLIEVGGVRLLTDPVLRSRLLGIIHRHGADPAAHVSRAIDGVLISHLHHDHLDFPSLRRVGRQVPVVVPAGGGRTLRRRRFANAVELRAGERTAVGAAEVLATTAVHEGRRFKIGPRVDALGYVVSAAGRRIYFAGDTDLFDGMEALGELDVALLPVAGWGPKVGRGHLDPRRAARAAAMLRPKVVIPIHWGTLIRADLRRSAGELSNEPAERFAAQLAELAPGVESAVLSPGAAFELPPPD
jgi:L-ascorbate metabolism protein UlaG (beta-lactamase superfamily)